MLGHFDISSAPNYRNYAMVFDTMIIGTKLAARQYPGVSPNLQFTPQMRPCTDRWFTSTHGSQPKAAAEKKRGGRGGGICLAMLKGRGGGGLQKCWDII